MYNDKEIIDIFIMSNLIFEISFCSLNKFARISKDECSFAL